MGAVADGALAAGGEVTGVIIPSMNTPALADTNLTHMVVADGMHTRKGRMHELADGYVALPGGLERSTSCSRRSPGRRSALTRNPSAC